MLSRVDVETKDEEGFTRVTLRPRARLADSEWLETGARVQAGLEDLLR